MCPYSTDRRERVAAAVDQQEWTLRETARLFLMSLSFVVHLLQRRRAASTLEPKPYAGAPPRPWGRMPSDAMPG